MMKREDVIGRVQGLSPERLDAWIERGWVSPVRGESGFIFEEIDVARIALIRELRDDLEVNREAMPIVLSLMDQVYSLRRELRCVVEAVEQESGAIRETIIARIKTRRR